MVADTSDTPATQLRYLYHSVSATSPIALSGVSSPSAQQRPDAGRNAVPWNGRYAVRWQRWDVPRRPDDTKAIYTPECARKPSTGVVWPALVTTAVVGTSAAATAVACLLSLFPSLSFYSTAFNLDSRNIFSLRRLWSFLWPKRLRYSWVPMHTDWWEAMCFGPARWSIILCV